MKRMKKLLAFLLAAMLLLTMIPISASAAPTVDKEYEGWGNVYYRLYDYQLLKMLYLNGDTTVSANTEINQVSISLNDKFIVSPYGQFKLNLHVNYTTNQQGGYWTNSGGLSNATGKAVPTNIKNIIITYDNGKSATISADKLRFLRQNEGLGHAEYEIEYNNDETHVVAFYRTSGGSTTEAPIYNNLYAVRFVENGQSISEVNMPPEPTYGDATGYEFGSWDKFPTGGDPFIAGVPIYDDTLVYERRSISKWSISQYHVMNVNDALLNRVLELYNASIEGAEPATLEDIGSLESKDTFWVEVNGKEDKHTDHNYSESEYKNDEAYFDARNGEVANENTHIPINEVTSITVYVTINGNGETFTIPVDGLPGGISVTPLSESIAEIIVNAPPTAPSDGDLEGSGEDDPGLLGNNAVSVDCINSDVTHENNPISFGLQTGTYTKELKWIADGDYGYYGYVISITNPGAYVTLYNQTNDGHSLDPANPETQTITLKNEGGVWIVPTDATPVTYTVKCETQQGGEDPNKPEKPTDEDIAAALKDIIVVTCDQTDKHDESERTKTFDATESNATITEADAVEGDAENGYTYKVTVSLTDDQRNAFIEQFDDTGEHHFQSVEPEEGQEFTLVYLPAQENVNEAMWIFDTNESDKFLTINVTCKDGGEQPGGDDEDKTPDEPTQEELKDLLRGKITVKCVNGKREHNTIEEVFGFLEKGIARNEIIDDGHGNFTTSVTVNGPVYVDAFEDRVKDAHKLTSDTVKYPTIQLKWAPNEDDPEDGSWTLDAPNAAVTFKVTCDVETEIVEGPGGVVIVPVEPEDPTDPDQTGVSDLLETDDHIQYLFGYPDDSFGPDRNMTRAEAAQMFYNLLKNQNVDAEPAFDDVPKGAWYATPVNVMAELGIVDGVGDDKFEPNREITRAEFTTMAMRFADVPSGGVNIFTDVAPSDWFYSYVVNSIQYGWIEGYGDGTFRPDRLITRAEVTTIVNRMLDRQADMAFVIQNRDKLTKFTDLTTEHWAYYTIVEATNEHDYKKPAIGEDWTSLK